MCVFVCVIGTTLLKIYISNGFAEIARVYWGCAGRKNSVPRALNFGYKGEQQLIGLMESEKEDVGLNRNLYPNIEPYSTGFLKVSEIHTIYWEQSGNPKGHVSGSWQLDLYLI
jgi:hypothetical protein